MATVVFDMDGVLINSVPDYKEILEKLGMPNATNIMKPITEIVPQEDVAKFQVACHNANEMPGAKRTVEALRMRGHQVLLGTLAPIDFTTRFNDWDFNYIISGKNKQELMNEIKRVAKSALIFFIDDSEEGIRIAKDNGFIGIHFSSHYSILRIPELFGKDLLYAGKEPKIEYDGLPNVSYFKDGIIKSDSVVSYETYKHLRSQDDYDIFSQGIAVMGVSVLLKTSDNKTIIAIRPDNGLYHTIPGGLIEFGEQPRQTLQRELFEELGVPEIKEATFLGIAHDLYSKGLELMYLVKANFTAEEIIKLHKSAKDRHESKDLIAISFDKLPEWLEVNKEKVIPASITIIECVNKNGGDSS